MASSSPTSFFTPSRVRRSLPLVIGVAALTVGAFGTGVASAAGASHTLRLTSVGIEDQIVNGVDIQTDRDSQNGKTTGYDVTSCAINFRTHVAACDVSVARANGMIYAVSTTNVDTGRGSGKVIGGTGAFRGVRGTVRIAPGSQPNSASITLTYHT